MKTGQMKEILMMGKIIQEEWFMGQERTNVSLIEVNYPRESPEENGILSLNFLLTFYIFLNTQPLSRGS